MPSILKPDASVMVGVSTAALVGFVYSYGIPNLATIGATQAQDLNIESGRKKAAWTGAVVVAGLSLLTRDKTVFVIGGVTLIALDFHARHANATPPTSTSAIASNVDYQPSKDVDVQDVVQNDDQQYAQGYGQF